MKREGSRLTGAALVGISRAPGRRSICMTALEHYSVDPASTCQENQV